MAVSYYSDEGRYACYPIHTPFQGWLPIADEPAFATPRTRETMPRPQSMVVILPLLTMLLFAFWIWQGSRDTSVPAAAPAALEQTNLQTADPEAINASIAASLPGLISPIFSPEVQHWAPQIVAWAQAHNLDPNMAATVMQIESCGDPNAVSIAGAQGLFQVMPFHFEAHENMQDPDTNARRGLAYLAARLVQTNGDVGRAFAGYNGGHGAAATSWDNWAHETQRYYVWSTGIYAEAQQGLSESPTLQQWMVAGGASLCRQAAQRLGLTPAVSN